MFDKKDIKPMLLGELDKPFNDNNYLYELKFDGYRVLIYASYDKIEIRSRNNIDITYLYPELKSIKKMVKNKKVIFDGEIVVLNNGKPSFSKLQARSHIKDKSKIGSIIDSNPVVFIAFDILYQDKELINEPLIIRKEILGKYRDNEVFIKSTIFDNGIKLFKEIKKRNLEGIVAKEKNSIYIPNKRVNYWIKIKNFKREYFYIHGFIFNKDKYSLLLGEYRNKELYFVGKISVVPKNIIMNKVLKEKKSGNKFVNHKEEARYIMPKIKVLVSYIERTDKMMLREPFLAQEKSLD